MSHAQQADLQPQQLDADQGDPHASTIVYGGVVGTLIVIALIIALQAMYYKVERAATVEHVYGNAYSDVTELNLQQQARLNSLGWTSDEKKLVRLPIERGLTLALSEINAGKKPAPPKPATPPATRASQP